MRVFIGSNMWLFFLRNNDFRIFYCVIPGIRCFCFPLLMIMDRNRDHFLVAWQCGFWVYLCAFFAIIQHCLRIPHLTQLSLFPPPLLESLDVLYIRTSCCARTCEKVIRGDSSGGESAKHRLRWYKRWLSKRRWKLSSKLRERNIRYSIERKKNRKQRWFSDSGLAESGAAWKALVSPEKREDASKRDRNEKKLVSRATRELHRAFSNYARADDWLTSKSKTHGQWPGLLLVPSDLDWCAVSSPSPRLPPSSAPVPQLPPPASRPAERSVDSTPSNQGPVRRLSELFSGSF